MATPGLYPRRNQRDLDHQFDRRLPDLRLCPGCSGSAASGSREHGGRRPTGDDDAEHTEQHRLPCIGPPRSHTTLQTHRGEKFTTSPSVPTALSIRSAPTASRRVAP